MKLTMLGTGNASVTECYNTCFVFSGEAGHFLVDTGGGNQILKRLSEAEVPMAELHDVFLTHAHIDHLFGVFWIIRVVGQAMNRSEYEGEFRIYCHEELAKIIKTITQLTIQKNVYRLIGDRIRIIPLKPGEEREIIGCKVTFFDIGSAKKKQYGFAMQLPGGKKLSCAGDEPYNADNYKYVEGSAWLMHEAFCLYGEADLFKPYEKSHSTVKEACLTAEKLGIANLILYHTEDKNIKDRKRLYTEEGQKFYHGNLFVPNDMEVIEL